MALFNECMLQCAQKVLDAADIVRDGDITSSDKTSRTADRDSSSEKLMGSSGSGMNHTGLRSIVTRCPGEPPTRRVGERDPQPLCTAVLVQKMSFKPNSPIR